MDYKYQGIIIGKIDAGETDRIYSAYTLELGKVRLLAKGVRKPNAKLAGNLEPINFVEIFVAKNRGRGKITGVINIENFPCIKEEILSLKNIFKIFRIFDRLITQEEKDEKIFFLLLNYLRSMELLSSRNENNNLKIDILSCGFIFKLLENSGYGIQAGKCVGCQKKLKAGENYFSAPLGGVLCASCSEREIKKIKISDETIKFIRIILENKIENLIKLKADEKNINNLKIIAEEAVKWTIN